MREDIAFEFAGNGSIHMRGECLCSPPGDRSGVGGLSDRHMIDKPVASGIPRNTEMC